MMVDDNFASNMIIVGNFANVTVTIDSASGGHGAAAGINNNVVGVDMIG